MEGFGVFFYFIEAFFIGKVGGGYLLRGMENSSVFSYSRKKNNSRSKPASQMEDSELQSESQDIVNGRFRKLLYNTQPSLSLVLVQ